MKRDPQASDIEDVSLPYLLESADDQADYSVGVPFRNRILGIAFVMSGSAVFDFNCIEYSLGLHDCMIIPPNTVMECRKRSDDYIAALLAIGKVPDNTPQDTLGTFLSVPSRVFLDEEDWFRLVKWLDLFKSHLKHGGPAREAVDYLLLSLLSDIHGVHESVEKNRPVQSHNRNEEVFKRFIAMLNEPGPSERSVLFYAERLMLSPNYLNNVIRRWSGRTVMDWINRATVNKAKMLLKYTDKMVYEIADDLQFSDSASFSHFFKKHVGMTPLDFKKGTRKDPA